jgi:hypothetical protein
VIKTQDVIYGLLLATLDHESRFMYVHSDGEIKLMRKNALVRQM